MDSKQFLLAFMAENKGILSSCKKQEILEFNNYYVGIQHLFCLIHKLYIMIIDKRLYQDELNILQKYYIDVHLKDKQVKMLFQENFYTEGSLNKMYEEQKQQVILKYSEQNIPILAEIDMELKLLEQNQYFNLQSLNIPDQNKTQFSIQQENLVNNALFAEKMSQNLSTSDSRLEKYIAIKTQELCIDIQLLNIQIVQYWLLLTQFDHEQQRGNQVERETIIKKHKDIYYFVFINQKFIKIQMTQQQIELFIYQLLTTQFDQYILQLKQQELFEYLKIEQPLNDITVRAEYFQFKDCTLRVVQKLELEACKLFYSLEILGVQGKFYPVYDCDLVQQLENKLGGFIEMNISKIISEESLFNKYFIKKIEHNIPKNCDPKVLANKIKFGSILLTDRFMFQHAALYLGCDLVFHYSQVQGDNTICSFKPERFDDYMKETTQLTELQPTFILRNKQELIEKAVEKSQEILQSSLINNYENIALEVITNYKGSNSLDFNTLKNYGANFASLFKIGQKQVQQH